MQQNESIKKLLVIIACSTVLFLIFRPKTGGNQFSFPSFGSKKKSFIKKPILDDSDFENEDIRLSYQALCAYIDAYNNGVSDEDLEEINDEFKQKMCLEVYTDENGMLAVKDAKTGADILVNS